MLFLPHHPRYLTVSQHSSRYVLNNPYKYIDPNGLWAVQIGLGGSIGAGLGVGGGAGFVYSYDKQVGSQFGAYTSGGGGIITSPSASGSIDIGFSPYSTRISDVGGSTVDLSLSAGEPIGVFGGLGESYSLDPKNAQEIKNPSTYTGSIGLTGRTPPLTASEYVSETKTWTWFGSDKDDISKMKKDTNLLNQQQLQSTQNQNNQRRGGNGGSSSASSGGTFFDWLRKVGLWNYYQSSNDKDKGGKKT